MEEEHKSRWGRTICREQHKGRNIENRMEEDIESSMGENILYVESRVRDEQQEREHKENSLR
jgi:hypothetical protein